MSGKASCVLLAAAMLLTALSGCGAQPEETPEEQAAEAVVIQTNIEADEPEPTLFLADDGAHPAVMSLKSDGLFHPGAPVTKAELCGLLMPLFEGLRGGGLPFADMERGDSGYRAVSALYGAGLLPDGAEAEFRPRTAVTRGYAAALLHNISDQLGGADRQRALLLSLDVTVGLTAPEGARTEESAWISRGETALILERLLDREPDVQNLFMNGLKPSDMSPEDPLWPYAADAVTAGRAEPVSGGVHRLYGWLYAAWDDGTMITDMDYGVWTFGPDGRYTTGSGALDEQLAQALKASGADELEGEAALRAAYLYVKYHFSYFVRPEDMETIPVGVTGWEYERAQRFFRYGGGTCYGYAAAFGLMARALGEHAYVVAAEVNQYYGDHGFVVIPEGDLDVIYDVELEATRPTRHADFDLFGIQNNTIYNYWYIANWREE